MAKVGIDFGSFHSVVAKRAESGSAEICVNDVSNRSTPTMVALEGRRILIGEECQMRIMSNLKQSVTHLVESLGAADAPENALWSMDNGTVALCFNEEEINMRPEELVALLLEKLVMFARADSQCAKTIAVPDWYSQEQVDVLHRSATLARLEHVSYVRHSDALCMQYLKHGNTGSVLIVDFGFGQTTCTLAVLGEDIEIIRRETDKVGVSNLIDACAKICIARAQEKYKQQVTLGSKKGFRLRQACQKALKELSMLPVAELNLECWLDDDVDFSIELTREMLVQAAKCELDQLHELISRVKGEEPVKVEIVGGGGRALFIQNVIAEVAGVTIEDLGKSLDGSSAVASGACCCAERAYSTWTPKDADLLEDSQALLKKLQDVDEKEKARLEAMNAFEAYLYEVKDWCSGKDKELLNCKEVLPYLDNETSWFLDLPEDTLENVYVDKLNEVQAYVKEKGKLFFSKREEDKLKFEKELEVLQKETDAKEHDDHDYRKLPNSERLRMAEKNRQEGNDVFQASNFQEAIIRYQKSQSHLAKLFDLSPDDTAEKNRILLSCHLNTAQCYLKGAQEVEKTSMDKALMIYKKVVSSCNSALEIDQSNIKALFRRATSLEKLGDFVEARSDIATALKLDPENTELKRSDQRIVRALEIQKNKAKKMYGKMFG